MDIAWAHGKMREEVSSRWMEEHGDAILRMCFLYLGDWSMAEDAVQELFPRRTENAIPFGGAAVSKHGRYA